MGLTNKQFRPPQEKTDQVGAVLVTGLIFILIVSMACFTTLENIRVFRVNDSDQLTTYGNFYQAEGILAALENNLFQTNFGLSEMNAFFEEQGIMDNRYKNFADDPAMLWQGNMGAIRQHAENQYLQEFLGFKRQSFFNPETREIQEVLLCIIRISIWQKDQPQYAIQSWLALVPEESRVQLDGLGLDAKSRRIAWNEYQ